MADEQKLREAFECWADDHGYQRRPLRGSTYGLEDIYKDHDTQCAWEGWKAALSHASATAEECSVDGRGIEPDREALSLMNGSLCKFGMNWLLDGDYLRCRVCKRPQIASCAHLDFPHASDCKCADDVENHPWLTLIGLLKPIAIDQAIAAKRGEK